ncbi:MAG TPA: phosphoribosyltransferase family protein [Candidatus Saccharimonadales bacterium]|nr:phosphoribosyltransferase family protein [Candidatus Saccharimonadales bacterium]
MFVLERLISVIAPFNCLSCGQEGSLICSNCASLVLPLPSRCYICKAVTENFQVCKRCRSKSRLNHVWVATEYSDLAKELLHFYKFERGQSANRAISSYMSTTLPLFEKPPLLVPVPTATSRLRMRGYDHTKLLAKAISSQTGYSYESLVGRLGQSRQVGAHREERLKQLGLAFYVKHPKHVQGQSIILIDDIVTTGGTLESVARVLRQAGAKSVNALVFAQKSQF